LLIAPDVRNFPPNSVNKKVGNCAKQRRNVSFRTRILLDQDILAGKHTVDDFAFEVDANGRVELSDDGKQVIEEALFLISSAEARGLPGYRGSIS